jgi:hypothetical protein
LSAGAIAVDTVFSEYIYMRFLWFLFKQQNTLQIKKNLTVD